MTIDDVMALAAEYRDASTFSGQCVAKKNLRAAILALLDAEAEACAGVCDHIGNKPTEAYLDPFDCATAIRARIAARKGGAKP
jgi:hypothetical protein